jgi:hypothetical protein
VTSRWLPVALLAGVAYIAIGRLFPQPTVHLQAWRLAAWIASAIVFAAHIAYERFTLRGSPRSIGLHTAAGVAIGAFGLAIFGMSHSISTGAGFRPIWIIALVAWPAMTAIPAFFVAMVAGVLLARMPRR